MLTFRLEGSVDKKVVHLIMNNMIFFLHFNAHNVISLGGGSHKKEQHKFFNKLSVIGDIPSYILFSLFPSFIFLFDEGSKMSDFNNFIKNHQ